MACSGCIVSLHHPDKVLAQVAQVSFVTKPGGEGFEGFPRVVLPSVEAPVYEGLDAAPQGVEQRGDHKRRGDYGQLGQLLLARERSQEGLGNPVTPPKYTSASVTVRDP